MIKISNTKSHLRVQISFKFINNLVSFNEQISTLLVFDVYSTMTEQDALSLSIISFAMAIQKAINEIQKYTIS